ncbi:RNA-dependent ATPase rok1 [Tulasnella sp. JGI-2019a]|nr:RNA-dependent ATPase rok1 [Tulasnella sp. JGI-2019a]
MEAFQLLSRGGVKFDKRKFKVQATGQHSPSTASTFNLAKNTIPTELDFFKYAQGPKGPATDKGKEREVQELTEEDDTSASSDGASTKKRKESFSPVTSPKRGRRHAHRIAATGSRVPASIDDFEELHEHYEVAPVLLQNIAAAGYPYPTAIQAQTIPILLEKRDLAGVSPTGTGKTLAYLLPMMARLGAPTASKDGENQGRGVRALVVAPTRELASQIHNECLKLAQGRKWRILLFHKGSNEMGKEARAKIDIIISTPLRLVAAIRDNSLELDNVQYLVLDEADHLLNEGFAEQTEEIVAACTHPDVQKSMFSATLPSRAERVAKQTLNDPIRVVVGTKDAASLHVTQSLTYVGSEIGKLYALRQLLATSPPLPLLIFVQTKERATELHQELLFEKLNVDMLHSGMTSNQRDESVTRMRNGETWVMVCTEVMARGMDFGGIKGVVNYDFPQTLQSYVHRIGRTGRAGRTGTAITYFTDADVGYLKPIATMVNQSNMQQTAFSNASAKTNLELGVPGEEAIAVPTSSVPEWMLKLRKPGGNRRKQVKTNPIGRKSVRAVASGRADKDEAWKKKSQEKKRGAVVIKAATRKDPDTSPHRNRGKKERIQAAAGGMSD